MFISRREKEQIQKEINKLAEYILGTRKQVARLSVAVNSLEEGAGLKKPRKKHHMSPESRAKMSAMMKDRHAKMKLGSANAASIITKSE